MFGYVFFRVGSDRIDFPLLLFTMCIVVSGNWWLWKFWPMVIGRVLHYSDPLTSIELLNYYLTLDIGSGRFCILCHWTYVPTNSVNHTSNGMQGVYSKMLGVIRIKFLVSWVATPRLTIHTRPLYFHCSIVCRNGNNFLFLSGHLSSFSYWVPQKLPQIRTVIAYICIGRVAWFAV